MVLLPNKYKTSVRTTSSSVENQAKLGLFLILENPHVTMAQICTRLCFLLKNKLQMETLNLLFIIFNNKIIYVQSGVSYNLKTNVVFIIYL